VQVQAQPVASLPVTFDAWLLQLAATVQVSVHLGYVPEYVGALHALQLFCVKFVAHSVQYWPRH
jgi:hypothetical protein